MRFKDFQKIKVPAFMVLVEIKNKD